MSIRIDEADENALVMEGMEAGISDNPYTGIYDSRNVNLVSIPGDASVLFATSKISAPNVTGSMTSSSSGADTVSFTSSPGLDSRQAITFLTLSDITKGLTLVNADGTPTVYWVVYVSSGIYQLQSTYPSASAVVDITGDGLTGTWATVNMGLPKYFMKSGTGTSVYYWMIDNNGRVWSNVSTTANSPFYWTYTGNKPNNYSKGNGLVYYQSSNGTGYIFAFSEASIDYTVATDAGLAWAYQWTPGTNYTAPGTWAADPTQILKSPKVNGLTVHEAITGPDNKVYYCDANWIGRWYQVNSTTAFNPEVAATYIFDTTAVLPFTDVAQCLTFLGNNLLIGGQKNIMYPWDTFSQLSQYPIFFAENNIQKCITINTNVYALVGNRGRVYITNGSQAQLFKKIPDHISNTVEPYFIWGGLASLKNQLYFGVYATTNSGGVNANYGGIWAIDVDTQALRLTNQLSYGTYAGYASALIANTSGNPSGTGFYAGWTDGSSGYGIDTTVGTLYTGSQASITFDMIPSGVYLKPKVFKTVEYKLSAPMVSGESVSIYYRLNIHDSFTLIWTDTATSTYLPFSARHPVNFSNTQWIQLKVVLNSVASNPSYVRLRELRLR